MGMTLTAKILNAHRLGPAAVGSLYHRLEVDVMLGHEATIALLIQRFENLGLRIQSPEKCLFAADHFVPPASPERATILQRYIAFLRQQGVSEQLLFKGISHQLMLEDPRVRPGVLVCGADSHTTMGGALGAFAAGYGSTDMLSILVTGEVMECIPPAQLFEVTGRLSKGVLPKDLALWMMKILGEGGGTGYALEWIDVDETLSIGGRATVSNMAVDCGALNGVWQVDARTCEYLKWRDGKLEGTELEWRADPDALYEHHHRVALETLPPLLALPGSPADVHPASTVAGEPVHQVVLGSCTSSDGEDIRAASRLLHGKKVASGLRLVVTPSSQAVYRSLMQDGTLLSLLDAGALITVPACGACGGIDKGLLGAGEVCVSTSNRNFRGRMGHPDARVYLGSGVTAAAAALTGRVCDPREILT
ncbi:MAG: 3-isopropylmalate dehydratase large subunit [Myxococcota bacterium]